VTDTLGQIATSGDQQGGQPAGDPLCVPSTKPENRRRIDDYATRKNVVTDAVIAELTPIRERTTALLDDPTELDESRCSRAARAREQARPRLAAAMRGNRNC